MVLPPPRRPLVNPHSAWSTRSVPDGALVKIDGTNAVQILLLVGGLTLVPALLFTVTGFTPDPDRARLHPHRDGHATAPPNQVLVGIALFLTMFVMTPTIKRDQEGRVGAALAAPDPPRPALHRAEEPLREFMFKQTRDERPRAVREPRARPAAEDAGRRPDLRADPGVHHERAQDGLSDRLLDLLAVPDHRPDRQLDADEHGHDDAAPVFISLPFKILLFVLVDGWDLVTPSLVASFH